MRHGNGPPPRDAQRRARPLRTPWHRPCRLGCPPRSHLSDLQDTESSSEQRRLCPHVQGTTLLSPDSSPKGAAAEASRCSPVATLPQGRAARGRGCVPAVGMCGTGRCQPRAQQCTSVTTFNQNLYKNKTKQSTLKPPDVILAAETKPRWHSTFTQPTSHNARSSLRTAPPYAAAIKNISKIIPQLPLWICQ